MREFKCYFGFLISYVVWVALPIWQKTQVVFDYPCCWWFLFLAVLFFLFFQLSSSSFTSVSSKRMLKMLRETIGAKQI